MFTIARMLSTVAIVANTAVSPAMADTPQTASALPALASTVTESEIPTVNPFFMPATITVSDGAGPIVRARIPRKDVDGLYPGDVWALDLRHKRITK